MYNLTNLNNINRNKSLKIEINRYKSKEIDINRNKSLKYYNK